MFNPKSRWQPPQGHPFLEVFLTQVENELLELPKADIKYYNLSREEWNATNFGKLYFLPKIHKRLHNVPGRPVILNCSTPTEKCSEFLDYHLKPFMQKEWSYIKDSGDTE